MSELHVQIRSLCLTSLLARYSKKKKKACFMSSKLESCKQTFQCFFRERERECVCVCVCVKQNKTRQ